MFNMKHLDIYKTNEVSKNDPCKIKDKMESDKNKFDWTDDSGGDSQPRYVMQSK
jgi:hypothetical protein